MNRLIIERIEGRILVGITMFVAIMILSWLRSRALPPDEVNPASAPDAEASTSERFKLD